MNSFVSIDFETAAPQRHTACEVAMTKIKDGKLLGRYYSLIKPPGNIYNGRNTAIHGIHPYHTRESKDFTQVWEEMVDFIGDFAQLDHPFMVAHNAAFERSVFNRSHEQFNLPQFELFKDTKIWACTYLIYKSKNVEGVKLNQLCDRYGIPLKHHSAPSDADACAHLYLKHLRDECDK